MLALCSCAGVWVCGCVGTVLSVCELSVGGCCAGIVIVCICYHIKGQTNDHTYATNKHTHIQY